jgi:polyisoprenyl-phosphate glycosyltransferase
MLSVVIPARNEEAAIAETVTTIGKSLDAAKIAHEIIVVDDGSTDRTGELARGAGATVIRHASSCGYGKSLKDGIMIARHDLIAITDADGTYPNQRLPELFKLVTEDGYDMAVGARTGKEYRGTFLKMPARRVFLWLSEYAAGRKIDDINSGLRVFRREIVHRYMHTISDGFSFTTTITLAAMLNGYTVKYIPIEYFKRLGKSHVRYGRDTIRTLQIIVSNILYYNPLKLFLLVVNVLMLMALGSGAAAILVEHARVSLLAAVVAGCSLAGAFVVGAIGLHAELTRTIQAREETQALVEQRRARREDAPPR